MVKLSDIFRSYGKTYLNKYSGNILPSHNKAIYDISLCRTPVMGGQVYECKKCKRYHYSYHSCGNRNCNTCQNDKADQWLQNNNNLLLPVNYFMVTFTLPEDLRHAARSNQKLFYNVLFKCSAQSIESFSSNSKFIGGKAGYLGVLHTWSRKLDYHPHVHYIVTGGGLSIKKDKWTASNNKFLFPVKALSTVFKAKFRDELRSLNPEVFNQIPQDTWKRNWVVNSIPVGNGSFAIKYLSQYVFRVAISNNRILKHENGYVTFKYKDSKTKIWKVMKLNTEEFMRRFLQHVLPRGFVKVRYFGLFASKNRILLFRVKELLDVPIKKRLSPSDKAGVKNKSRIIYCPECGKEMMLILSIGRTNHYNKSPPIDNYLSSIGKAAWIENRD